MIKRGGLQETSAPHEAVHLLKSCLLCDIIGYLLCFCFYLLVQKNMDVFNLLPILKTSSIGVEGNGRN